MSDPKLSTSEANAASIQATEPLGAQQAVMIFVKRPAPGRVKTRLAAGVGADAACAFYRACCEHVVTRVVGGDVGARMQAAFQHVLGLGYQRVVVIGTDIPDVDGVTVAAALSALKRHKVVFGPALDGGYYLLGLTALLPCLFNGIEWSTDRVLQQSLSALHTNGVADPGLQSNKRRAAGGGGTLEADAETDMAMTSCGKARHGKDGSRAEQASEQADKEDAAPSGGGKTGHEEDALRTDHVRVHPTSHAGVHPTSHAPCGEPEAEVCSIEGETQVVRLIAVVAGILGQVSPVGATGM
ncbi:unnamed protein product [Closterium sp. Yama58-4]|nr:unnamed protein product [Closterium sp. Yama58-4]